MLAGAMGEAQERLAGLPGLAEAAALASAAGPEKEQAASLPRDATADVWLREGEGMPKPGPFLPSWIPSAYG